MPLYNKPMGLTNYKSWVVGKAHGVEFTSTKMIGEEWSVQIMENVVVSLFHHCKGTKGLVAQYLKHTGVGDGQPGRYVYGECDLCGASPDENTVTLIQMYNVRI